MTAEEHREYNKRYREKIKANPDLQAAVKRARKKYHHNKYLSDPTFRESMIERQKKRIENMKLEGTYDDFVKYVRESRREKYKNDKDFRERVKARARERYHQTHPGSRTYNMSSI